MKKNPHHHGEKPPEGVPESARLVRLTSLDFLNTINALLRPNNLRVRAKAFARGGGCPTWVWTETITNEGASDERS